MTKDKIALRECVDSVYISGSSCTIASEAGKSPSTFSATLDVYLFLRLISFLNVEVEERRRLSMSTESQKGGQRRLNVLLEQLDSDVQFITAARNAAEAARRAPGAKWTNHAELGYCNPGRHLTPTSVEDVQRIIRDVAARRGKCRVAGTGKSPNAITFTEQTLLHSEGLSRVVSVDTKLCTVTCEGGALLADVHRVLDANGLMLKCVPSIVDMTVAGAIGTAAHSSGIGTKSLSAYVNELIFVNGLGQLVELSRAENPRELRLAACHLGALGFITQVTLQAEKKATWRLTSDVLTVARMHQVLAQRVMTSEYYRFWWTPHTDACYETIGRRVNAADEEGRGDTQSAAAQSTMSGATAKSDTPLGKMKRSLAVLRKETTAESDYRTWQKSQDAIGSRVMAAVKGMWLKHHTLEASLLASCYVPAMQPLINKAYQRIFLSSPQEYYGSAVDAFTFDCLFKQWACEWAVEAHRALEAFDLIRHMISSNGYKVHFPVEFRFCDEDDVALSPAVGRKVCWIGVVMYRPHGTEARDTVRVYNSFCELMQRLGGRPHWAKYFKWRRRDVANAYGMHWQRWLEFRELHDPHRIFVNSWLNEILTQD